MHTSILLFYVWNVHEINYHYQRHHQYKMQCVINSLSKKMSTADSITQYGYVNILP